MMGAQMHEGSHMMPGAQMQSFGQPLVLDSWRHKQVGAKTVGETPETLSPMLTSRTGVSVNSAVLGVPSLQLGQHVQQAFSAPDVSTRGAHMLLGLPSAEPGATGQGPHELDERRLGAVKNVWRRLDPTRQGWVAMEDIAKELQRVSDLSVAEQQRLMQGLNDGSSKRVHYATFVEYYMGIHGTVSRHCDFEELLRTHWGFSEVSEILDDMKNKLAAVGLAYAFRQVLDQFKNGALGPAATTAGLLLEEFEKGLNGVNINYRPQDVRKVFTAFQQSGHVIGDRLKLTSLVEQLTGAPRPKTPLRKPQTQSSGPAHHMAAPGASPQIVPSPGGVQGSLHSTLPAAPSMPPPAAPMAAAAPAAVLPAPAVVTAAPTGKKRALTIGINYIGHRRGTLSGCINDSNTFLEILSEKMGFKREEIRQLRDDHHASMPTKANMLEGLRWLVQGATEGDHLFLHYSGHGSQQTDRDGDELDGRDETLVPCDYQHAGMLSDDELRRVLVLPLSKGVRLTAILDCCHSGTVLDLPFKIYLDPDGSAEVKRKSNSRIKGSTDADIVMISGCMDSQTSADIGAGAAGNAKSAGAMTTAFKVALQKSMCMSYHKIIDEMRTFLKEHRFQQKPQLMAEQFLNLTDCFLPEAEPPDDGPPPALRPPARRAVTIGINYLSLPRGRGQLAGCINDSDTIVELLKDTFGYEDSMIRRLRDDRQDMMPTRSNMLNAFNWLCGDAQPGDQLFLHYSGHGGQMEDKRGDEADGKDETLLPCDFQSAGQITDDELYATLVSKLPKGCCLIVVLDCCHSGTALDLRFKVQISADGRSAKCSKKHRRTVVGGRHAPEPTKANVIMLSGCKDSQTSADIGAGQAGAEEAAGAMTTALRSQLTPSISCHKLLKNMRRFLKRNRFAQVPQMSSEQFVQLNSSFANYQAKRKGQRDVEPPVGIGPPQ